MKRENSTDYNTHYESILSIKKDQGKINASDFIHYISELIVKHSVTIGKNFLNKEGNKE